MQHLNGEFHIPVFPVRFDGAPAPVKPSPLLGEYMAQIFGDWPGISGDHVVWETGAGTIINVLQGLNTPELAPVLTSLTLAPEKFSFRWSAE